MTMLTKSLLAVVAVLVVTPAVAFALPFPQCTAICDLQTACSEECFDRFVSSTCGPNFPCSGSVAPASSTPTAEDQQDEDVAPVCRGEQLAEPQSATPES
jgi:hypothetical protein